jgi:hypothetical protein
LRADTVTAIAAGVVAIAALFVTIWDSAQTRKHNRLTVMPKVSFNLNLSGEAGGVRATLSLTNNGLGPALYEGIAIQYRGARKGDGFYTSWLAFKDSIIAPGVIVTRALDIGRDEAMPVGREYVLLAVESDSAVSPNAITEVFRGLAARVRYRSVYGDVQEVQFGEDPPTLDEAQELSSAASTRSHGNAARGLALLCAKRITPCGSTTIVPLSWMMPNALSSP